MSALALAWLAAAGCREPPAEPEPPAAEVPIEPAIPWVRDLSDSHTRRVDAACTLHVAPTGDDTHDGRDPARALATPGRAVAVAGPGDVACFARGVYPGFAVQGVQATADAPLVFRTVPGHERAATFTSGSIHYGAGVYVAGSAHVHVYDLRIADSQSGIVYAGVSDGRIEGLLIEGMGQGAIYVGRERAHDGSQRFAGPASQRVDVIGNTIRGTGEVTPKYGEGVYVGTGGLTGDDTHHVFVAYNEISEVRAEGIELKPEAWGNVVRGNLIYASEHEFHGAITVGAQAVDARSGDYLVEDNRIYDYADRGTSVAGITIGHGDGVVRNNVIWSIEGGRGIRTTTTFANQNARRVLIEGNTIWTPGDHPSIALHDGDERTGLTDALGDVTARGNVTDDGSVGSQRAQASDFVGPTAGDADAGQGAGSGFRLQGETGADLGRIVGG